MRKEYIAPQWRDIIYQTEGLCGISIEAGDDERAPQTAPKLGLEMFDSKNYWENNEEDIQQ
ncbi:MAG: hypothetical protein IJM84_01610 [Bacteroidaceae bacterium]|nr:hypothetical protein [Bacteroidaceae bacterium]